MATKEKDGLMHCDGMVNMFRFLAGSLKTGLSLLAKCSARAIQVGHHTLLDDGGGAVALC